MEISEKDIGNALMGLMHRIDIEYDEMTQEDLESRWHFRYDPESSLTWNMYLFHDYLSLYAGSCRRWEEKHNGHCCVVERVRDKYIIPKIKEFEKIVRDQVSRN